MIQVTRDHARVYPRTKNARVYLRTKKEMESMTELDIHVGNWKSRGSGEACFVRVVLEGQS